MRRLCDYEEHQSIVVNPLLSPSQVCVPALGDIVILVMDCDRAASGVVQFPLSLTCDQFPSEGNNMFSIAPAIRRRT